MLLTLSEEAQAKRGEFGKERYETTEIQKKVAANFEAIFDADYWRRVNADQNVEQLHEVLLNWTEEAIVAAEATEPMLLRWKWTF